MHSNILTRTLVGAVFASLLSGCSVGVKRTPGMKLYSAGQIGQAIPMLEKEVAEGQVTARYPLGLAYRDGTGVERDRRKAEILLTGAAIAGDPRAVSALRQLLADANRCDIDAKLRGDWQGLGIMHRNLITGVVELNTAPPAMLRKMAVMYEQPCAGAPVQHEAAKSLRALAGGPRHIWIYIP